MGVELGMSPRETMQGCVLRCSCRFLRCATPVHVAEAVLAPPFLPVQGISGAIQSYIQLHDRPSGRQAQEVEALLAGMSAEEQKR